MRRLLQRIEGRWDDMSEKAHRLSRERLYELVWSEPMTKVATRFGLSDVGLKKICRKHNIPVPGRGYWRKLETGKRAKQIPLTPTQASSPEIEIFGKRPSEAEHKKPEAVAAQASFEELPVNRIIVASAIERSHHLTAATKRQLKGTKPDEYGVLKCVAPELFYLRIGPGSVDRVLRILDALFKAFRVRDFDIQPSNRKGGRAHVLVHGEALTFSIEERVQQQPHRLTDEEKRKKQRGRWYWAAKYDFIPTGILTLKLDTGYGSGIRGTWSDTKHQRIENRLNALIVAMVELAMWKKEDRHRREEAERRRDEENARRAALHERQMQEAEAVKQLRIDAAAWNEAEELRRYIAAVTMQAEATDKLIDSESEIARWIKWATDQADRLDPLKDSPSSILDETVPSALYSWQ